MLAPGLEKMLPPPPNRPPGVDAAGNADGGVPNAPGVPKDVELGAKRPPDFWAVPPNRPVRHIQLLHRYARKSRTS